MVGVRIGLQIPDFTWPGGPQRLGAVLSAVARIFYYFGLEFTSVMK